MEEGPGTLPPASPEEQKLAVKAIENIVDNMYGEGWEPLVKELQGTPPEQLSETMGRIVASDYMSQEMFARAAGKELPQSIAMSVAEELVTELMRIVVSQGIYEPQSDDEAQQIMGEAAMYAADTYKQTLQQTGRYDEQAAQQLASDIASGKYDGAQQAGAPATPAPNGAPPAGGQDAGIAPGPGGQAPAAPGAGAAPQPSPIDVYQRAKQSAGG